MAYNQKGIREEVEAPKALMERSYSEAGTEKNCACPAMLKSMHKPKTDKLSEILIEVVPQFYHLPSPASTTRMVLKIILKSNQND